MIDGKKVLKVKVPEKALDQLLWYVSAQMEECPHGRDWEKCSDCIEGKFE